MNKKKSWTIAMWLNELEREDQADLIESVSEAEE